MFKREPDECAVGIVKLIELVLAEQVIGVESSLQVPPVFIETLAGIVIKTNELEFSPLANTKEKVY
jgi:hypothetical protein